MLFVKKSLIGLLAVVLTVLMTSAPAIAGEEEKNQPTTVMEEETQPTTVTLTGIIWLEQDEDGKTIGAILTTQTDDYDIVLDRNGKKLAKLEGKKVEVVGVVSDNKLTVKKFKEITEPEEQEKDLEDLG